MGQQEPRCRARSVLELLPKDVNGPISAGAYASAAAVAYNGSS
jgi:hypothetical protein